jgi:hypothetical protein
LAPPEFKVVEALEVTMAAREESAVMAEIFPVLISVRAEVVVVPLVVDQIPEMEDFMEQAAVAAAVTPLLDRPAAKG